MQAEIGATGALVYDLTAACSGFVGHGQRRALRGGSTARAGDCADARRYVDWRPWCAFCLATARACVLSKPRPNDCCLLGFDTSDGTGNGNLTAAFVSESNTEKTAKPTSESQTAASAVGAFANVQMNGQEVFKFAVRAVPDTLAKSLAKAGVSAEEIDHLVLHQANQRIIDGAADSPSARKRWCPTSKYGAPARDPCPSPWRRRRRGGSSRGTSSQPPGLALG